MSALLMAILLNGMTGAEIAALDHRDDRLRDPDGPVARSAGRPWTSTPPAASGTRSRCRWRRWSPPAGPRCRSCPAAGSATPAARWTRWSRSRAGGRRSSRTEMIAQLAAVGAVICAASADLAPADRKLYALRDVTGTVESIPMIAASIMSKKIAEGTGALVLDVKVGSGAFMKRADHAAELARTMVELGARAGRPDRRRCSPTCPPRSAVAVGNAVEVAESVEVLAGGGPADVVELTLALARRDGARWPASTPTRPTVLASGRAMDSWRAMVAAQGGDPDARPADAAVPRGSWSRDAGGRRARAGRAGRRASPPGGWAPAGPARSTPCRQAAGILCLAKPGDPVARRAAAVRAAHRHPGPVRRRAGRPGGRRRHRAARHRCRRPPLVLDVITAG